MATTSQNNNNNYCVPIWQKPMLTLGEAAAYYNIGINKLRDIAIEDEDNDCDFVLRIGNKRLIKRSKFDTYLSNRTYL